MKEIAVAGTFYFNGKVISAIAVEFELCIFLVDDLLYNKILV